MRIATRLSYYTGLLAFVAANSFAQCYDVAGVIKLTPVPVVTESGEYTVEFDDFGCAFPFPEGLDSDFCITSYPDPSAYFDIKGSGNVSFKGTSELTAVPVAGLEGTFAITPLIYPEYSPFPYPPTNASRTDLQSFTTQAILVAKFRGLRGTLYTKDTGVITQLTPDGGGGFSGQIVKIVGGDGDFDGATGLIGVAGQEIFGEPGSAATYTGRFCLPPD